MPLKEKSFSILTKFRILKEIDNKIFLKFHKNILYPYQLLKYIKKEDKYKEKY